MAVAAFPVDRQPAAEEPAGTGSSGGGPSADRVARLEAAVEGLRGEMRGLRHPQIVTITAIAIFGAAILGLGTYTLNRVDRLPSELNSIANSLANAITASRPSQPVIVTVPLVREAPADLPQPSQPDR